MNRWGEISGNQLVTNAYSCYSDCYTYAYVYACLTLCEAFGVNDGLVRRSIDILVIVRSTSAFPTIRLR